MFSDQLNQQDQTLFINIPLYYHYLRQQAENGLQLWSSENGKTVWYGLVWFDMV